MDACSVQIPSQINMGLKAGNFVGWPMLTERNVSKYYPDMDETWKGAHESNKEECALNQSKKATI